MPTLDLGLVKGAKGDQGVPGPAGEQGVQGLQGIPGKDALINGVNTLTMKFEGGITGEQNNNVLTVKGAYGDNAGAHNAIYRGKFLGEAVTAEQYAAISAGTFEDLYIGDYWTIGDVNYRIAAFDYYWNTGSTKCLTHHVVLVPDTALYTARMNATATTEGGYTGSEMYLQNLEEAKTIVKGAFPNHIMSHQLYLVSEVVDGYPASREWCESEVDLMNEIMVYGSRIMSPMGDGTIVVNNRTVEKSQLPLFAHNHGLIGIGSNWRLRDVCSASYFALVTNTGLAYAYNATASLGVRPAFCIA